MFLPAFFNSKNALFLENQINKLLGTNQESVKYGLILTAEEAREIIEERNHVLKSYGRVELDIDVTRKLIANFCSSSFINQEDYATTIIDLQELFYHMKNETEDKIGDDELINIIKDFYNFSCGGSLELLKEKGMEIFARDFRRQNQKFALLKRGGREWE